jgi:hypothetical protein
MLRCRHFITNMQISLVGSSGEYPCARELLDPAVVLRSDSGGDDVVRLMYSQRVVEATL